MEKERTACFAMSDTRLSAAELSLVLGISEWTVLKLARAKELPCEHGRRGPEFSLEKLIKFFDGLEAAA
jgi:hypothetical protein